MMGKDTKAFIRNYRVHYYLNRYYLYTVNVMYDVEEEWY